MPTLHRFLKHLPISSPAMIAGTMLTAAAGAALFFLTARTIESDAEARFRSMARVAQYTISARIKSYTDVLRGTAGLFRANPDVTAEQFENYVEQLDLKSNFPGIQVINYAVSGDESQRPAFEKRIQERLRSMGAPHPERFKIKQREPGSTYTVFVYIQPIPADWINRIGLDLEARVYARKALNQARDGNTLTASGTRIPIISGPNRHGLALRLPVYRSSMPINTPEQRRAAYIGSVGIGFGVNDLITGVFDSLPMKDTRLVVTDLTPVPPEPGESQQPTTLFDSAYQPGRPLPVRDEGASFLHVALPIEFNQRTWMADFTIPRRAVYTDFDAFYPWLAALAGSLSTVLLYALFQTLAASRRSAIKIAEEMTRELRASKAKLQASHEKLRRLAAHTDQIKEGERKRIAREIHDELGQNLLALRIDAEMLTSRTRERHGRLHARADATLRQIDDTIRSVRQIINDLRPNVLDLGLNAAVDWQVEEFRRRTGIVCYLMEDDAELVVDDRCATACFRILQESLSNIARHAQASEVHVELRLQENVLSMSISDNGIGLQPGSRNRQGSFGLVGIEERVNILGGTFSISSAAGTGTTLLVKVPLDGYTGSALTQRPTANAVTPLAA